MPWWVWLVLAIAAVWVTLGVTGRNRNRRAQATVWIPETGPSALQISTDDTSPQDLQLLALCYASKIRWLMASEPPLLGEMLRKLCGEAVECWMADGVELIDRMPTARAMRDDTSAPKAVSGGERFSVGLFRTNYQTLNNRAWAINSLPRPGLAPNVPWSVVLLLNGVHGLLAESDSQTLKRALSLWHDRAFCGPVDQSQAGLRNLFAVSSACVLEAQGREARSAWAPKSRS